MYRPKQCRRCLTLLKGKLLWFPKRIKHFYLTLILIPLLMFEFFDKLCVFTLCYRLQAQESMLAQSQTCVQELTSELRTRCLELRELKHNMQDQEKLLQVRDK